MTKLLAIVGPTASGKTALSISIAKKFHGEIIAADSRTIYKSLDVGTAKPTAGEREGIPHWGLDLVGPGQKYTVADYKVYADQKISEIQGRNHLPILVGGSGLYVDAVMYDYRFAPANEVLRKQLERLNINELQDKIFKSGLALPENRLNKRYLVRTLERGGAALVNKPLDAKSLIVGINPGRTMLKDRITLRAHEMIEQGVIAEIKSAGVAYGWQSEAMTGGIYRIFKDYIHGQKGLDESIEDFVKSDMRLVKKQMTWFKRNSDIHWFSDLGQAGDWLDNQLGGKLK